MNQNAQILLSWLLATMAVLFTIGKLAGVLLWPWWVILLPIILPVLALVILAIAIYFIIKNDQEPHS